MKIDLLAVYSSFQIEHWKKLDKMILMNHSKESNTYKVFDYFQQNRKSLDRIPEADKVRSKFFPSIARKSFHNILSRINIITEEFLVLKYFDKNKVERELLLNKIYNESGFFKKADQKANRTIKEVQKQKLLSLEKHQILSKLYHQQYYCDNPIKYKKGTILLEDLVNQELLKSKIQLLVYVCELQSWGKINKYDYTQAISIIREVNVHLPHSELSDILEVLSNLLSEPNKEDFLNLRTCLFNDTFMVPGDLHTIITMYLLNTAIQLWHMDIYRDSNSSIELFEYALDKGVLLYNGKIPVVRFHNLINTLGVLKDYEWGYHFIEKWKSKVSGKHPESTSRLAHAQNAFIHEKYEKIIPLIRGVEYESFKQKIIALGLELIVLFVERRQNYSLLRNFILNFKRTLKRNRTSESVQFLKSHLNLIKVIEILIKRDFTKVTIHLKKYDYLIYRTWLLKQIKKTP